MVRVLMLPMPPSWDVARVDAEREHRLPQLELLAPVYAAALRPEPGYCELTEAEFDSFRRYYRQRRGRHE